MRVVFSMDGIENMDQLYTCSQEYSDELGSNCTDEHYHGEAYCKTIISSLAEWKDQKYIVSDDRIAKETFVLTAPDGAEYTVSFIINTYNDMAARMEVTITAPELKDPEEYDFLLERLKITLKDKLISDWQECTWLVDEQAATLCKDVYERSFMIENNLRAFVSKVLIHFLGVNWIQRAGMEKEAESVKNLKEKFTQRVPEFENINADFLSMTLETLMGVMFEGLVYKDDVILDRQQYAAVQKLVEKGLCSNIGDFLKARRIVDKKIWDDLFVPFIDSPESFKAAVHAFIEDRNHIAHSKVLSWNSYQVILNDFQVMNSLIELADNKFELDEASQEMYSMWMAEQDEAHDTEYEKLYYRGRLAGETGMVILDEDGIKEWFDEVLYEIFADVYQRYHLDVCYEISDFTESSKGEAAFSVSCPVAKDLRIAVTAEYSIDDDLGGDSTCNITAKNASDELICKAQVYFHNGNGSEGEEGLMEAYESTEYDTSELDDFKEELFDAIEDLNTYPAKAETIAYINKGGVQVIADFPCEQCGKFGVSVYEELLPIGKCCYCGYENEVLECAHCGELVSAYDAEHDLCPSCAAHIDEQ